MGNNYQHMMIDLETLGTDPGCVILQIGMVFFNVDDETVAGGSIGVDIDSCVQHGLHVSGSTIAWWFRQSAAARRNALQNQTSLDGAFDHIWDLWTKHALLDAQRTTRVWSHGATFDLPILAAAARTVRKQLPWHHIYGRDTRTLADLYPVPLVEPTIPHDAYEDALAQAQWVRAMLREHRSQK